MRRAANGVVASGDRLRRFGLVDAAGGRTVGGRADGRERARLAGVAAALDDDSRVLVGPVRSVVVLPPVFDADLRHEPRASGAPTVGVFREGRGMPADLSGTLAVVVRPVGRRRRRRRRNNERWSQV